jgi:hypothetical protein
MDACVDLFRGPVRPLGNPSMVDFNLGRGGVQQGRPVAGQLRGTQMRAGLTLHVAPPVLSSRGRVTSIHEVHTSQPGRWN